MKLWWYQLPKASQSHCCNSALFLPVILKTKIPPGYIVCLRPCLMWLLSPGNFKQRKIFASKSNWKIIHIKTSEHRLAGVKVWLHFSLFDYCFMSYGDIMTKMFNKISNPPKHGYNCWRKKKKEKNVLKFPSWVTN